MELQAGETIAIAGLVQTSYRVARTAALPIMSDIPYPGALFRNRLKISRDESRDRYTWSRRNLLSRMVPHEVPPFGPGQETTSPERLATVHLNGRPAKSRIAALRHRRFAHFHPRAVADGPPAPATARPGEPVPATPSGPGAAWIRT